MIDKVEITNDDEQDTEPQTEPPKSRCRKILDHWLGVTLGKKELGTIYIKGKSSFAIGYGAVMTLAVFLLLGGTFAFEISKVNTIEKVQVSKIANITELLN